MTHELPPVHGRGAGAAKRHRLRAGGGDSYTEDGGGGSDAEDESDEQGAADEVVLANVYGPETKAEFDENTALDAEQDVCFVSVRIEAVNADGTYKQSRASHLPIKISVPRGDEWVEDPAYFGLEPFTRLVTANVNKELKVRGVDVRYDLEPSSIRTILLHCPDASLNQFGAPKPNAQFHTITDDAQLWLAANVLEEPRDFIVLSLYPSVQERAARLADVEATRAKAAARAAKIEEAAAKAAKTAEAAGKAAEAAAKAEGRTVGKAPALSASRGARTSAPDSRSLDDDDVGHDGYDDYYDDNVEPVVRELVVRPCFHRDRVLHDPRRQARVVALHDPAPVLGRPRLDPVRLLGTDHECLHSQLARRRDPQHAVVRPADDGQARRGDAVQDVARLGRPGRGHQVQNPHRESPRHPRALLATTRARRG